MRIYIAGPYVARDYLRGVAAVLTAQGHTITSRWLHEEHELTPGVLAAAEALTDEQVRQHVLDDMADVEAATALVIFTADAIRAALPRVNPDRLTSGGRHVEMGYALAWRKPVYVVGQPENVFQRCAVVYETAHEMGEALKPKPR